MPLTLAAKQTTLHKVKQIKMGCNLERAHRLRALVSAKEEEKPKWMTGPIPGECEWSGGYVVSAPGAPLVSPERHLNCSGPLKDSPDCVTGRSPLMNLTLVHILGEGIAARMRIAFKKQI